VHATSITFDTGAAGYGWFNKSLFAVSRLPGTGRMEYAVYRITCNDCSRHSPTCPFDGAFLLLATDAVCLCLLANRLSFTHYRRDKGTD
jgi:hypothetical protein